MPKQTTTSFALLGLLRLRPWTTYELAKQAQRSLNWFWPRAERKLYDEPKRLAEAGLATASSEATGKRPRTVYSISPAGHTELAAWLGTPSQARSTEFEAMLKVFFSDAGTLEQLTANLDAIGAEAEARLAQLRAMAGAAPPFPERLHLSALTIRLYIDQERTIRDWTVWAREQVDQWRSTTDPGTWPVDEVIERLLAD